MSSPHIVMLVIGESGAGKSTFLNYMATYLNGGSFDEQIHFKTFKIVVPNHLFPQINYNAAGRPGQHSEMNIHETSMSQTQKCTAYNFVWNHTTYVQIIDTPGFNDTDVKKDDKNIQAILVAAEKAPFITAILITINGTISRLSTSLKSTLNQLRGSLPDRVFNNLFFIFTNCTEDSFNFDIKLIQEYNPVQSRQFLMQNSLFSRKGVTLDAILSDRKLVTKMAQNWVESEESMERLMQEIHNTASISSSVFKEMRERRNLLLVHKENLITRQKTLLETMHHLEIEKERLVKAAEDQTKNTNYTQRKTIEVTEIETKTYKSTLCSRHRYVKVCHENCQLTFEPDNNFGHFQSCWCADANKTNCKMCGCSLGNHLHAYEIPVTKNKSIDDIIQVKKAAFDRATRAIKSSVYQIHLLDSTVSQYQNELNDVKNNLLETIRQLKLICSHFNFPEELKGTVEKLRKEAATTTNNNAKQEYRTTADAIEQLIQQVQSSSA
ncbi:unnamed protein product [Rotaria socialis]